MARKKIVHIWEGRFKNLFTNFQHLMVGNISASSGETPFYNEVDLQTSKHHVTGSLRT